MYIFLGFIAVALVAGILVFRRESKRVAKLRQEKADGKWDFIEMEYLPYLKSHANPLRETGKLSFKIIYDSYSWDLSGILYYNAAGIYAQFDVVLDSAPRFLFVWGKDKPSRFCPEFELYFHSFEVNGSDIVIHLKTKENLEQSNYTFIIKKAHAEHAEELKKVLPPGF